jgi:hypothetical protein
MRKVTKAILINLGALLEVAGLGPVVSLLNAATICSWGQAS